MGEALYSNKANNIAKTGSSILGGMLAVAAAGAIASLAGVTLPFGLLLQLVHLLV